MEENVVLKNGVRMKGAILLVTMMFLDMLKPGILAELAKKCHDPNYELSSEASQKLNDFIEDGRVHEHVRDIVLAAVTIEGGCIILDQNPILEPA